MEYINRKKLRVVRLTQEKTLQDVAGEANMETSTLCKIEKGNIRNPSIYTLLRICEALGISIAEIVNEPQTKG